MRSHLIPFADQPFERGKYRRLLTQGTDAECWIWRGELTPGDRPRFRCRDKVYQCRRLALEAAGIRIPRGKVAVACPADARCLNPWHLRVTSRRLALLAAPSTVAARNAATTHCPQGHPYSGRNLYPIGRGRACRACRSAWEAERRRKQREEEHVTSPGDRKRGRLPSVRPDVLGRLPQPTPSDRG